MRSAERGVRNGESPFRSFPARLVPSPVKDCNGPPRGACPRIRAKRNMSTQQTSKLVYIGVGGSVVALDRATGEQVWATHLKGSEFVNVFVEDGKVFATCYGEAFCLDARTGNGLWHNRLKGFGRGLAAIATGNSAQAGLTPALAEHRRQEEEAASAAAVTAAT